MQSRVASSLPSALHLAGLGFRVVPKGAKKSPAVDDWPNAATANPEDVRSMWRRFPAAGVCVATGRGLVVVDIDPRHGGDQTLSDLLGKNDPLPPTPTVRTGSGGTHIYFRTSEAGWKNRANILPGIDIRTDGGQVVAPPSIHPDTGEPYTWTTPPETPLATMPDWLDALLRPRPAAPVRVERPAAPVAVASRYAEKVIDSALAKIGSATEGARNETLRDAAFAAGQYAEATGIDRASALASMVAEAVAIGLTEREAQSTAARAFDAGARNPKRPTERHTPQPQQRRQAPAQGVSAPEADEDADDWTAGMRRAGNGKLRPSLRNAILILENDPAWAGRLWLDEYRDRRYLGDRELGAESLLSEMRQAIEERYSIEVGSDTMAQAVDAVCTRRRRDPLVEYLDNCAANWDGSLRLADWLGDALGVRDDLGAVYGWRWAVGAVARALQPGCKLDTCMIVIGPQGAKKSSTLRALVGPEWFSDTEIDLENKDAYLQIRGAWVHELAELS
ncbi:MAG: bifunctional DNA primase/polymerase, partial [Alphaproteobacteria bacterium]